MSEKTPTSVPGSEVTDYVNVDYYRDGDELNGEVTSRHAYGIDSEGKKIHVAVDDMLQDRGYEPEAYKDYLAEPLHKEAVTELGRLAFDRQTAVDLARDGLKFAKHGYSRKERKEAEAKEEAKKELEIKAARQASGQIPTTSVEGMINNFKQNMVFRREMKRATGDARVFAKLEIRNREQAAHARLEDFSEAYKEARHQKLRTRNEQLRARFHPNGRTKFSFLPRFQDPGSRVRTGRSGEIMAASELDQVTPSELAMLKKFSPGLHDKHMSRHTK